MEEVQALETIFAQVEGPRLERTKRHRLRDILIIAICGTICGAEGWVEIEEFGKAKASFFQELLDLPMGVVFHNFDNSCFSPIVTWFCYCIIVTYSRCDCKRNHLTIVGKVRPRRR